MCFVCFGIWKLQEETIRGRHVVCAEAVPSEPHTLRFEPARKANQPPVTESCRYAALRVGPDRVAATTPRLSPNKTGGGGGSGIISMLCLDCTHQVVQILSPDRTACM